MDQSGNSFHVLLFKVILIGTKSVRVIYHLSMVLTIIPLLSAYATHTHPTQLGKDNMLPHNPNYIFLVSPRMAIFSGGNRKLAI